MGKDRVIIFVRVYFRVGPSSVESHCESGSSSLSEAAPLISSRPPNPASNVRCMLRLRIRKYRRHQARQHQLGHHFLV